MEDHKYQINTSSSSDESDETDYYPQNKRSKHHQSEYRHYNYLKNQRLSENGTYGARLPTRQPKCFTKNAVMARQNRLRKKQYVHDLEVEVDKLKGANESLSSILNSQSSLIAELRKEVKYMKSVLANSSDISKLLGLINHNTGMSVSTSLNRSLSLTSNCLSKSEHPWAETNVDDSLLMPDLGLLRDDDDDDDGNILYDCDNSKNLDLTLEEHNYTTNGNQENIGVCLHVSKHRVSLEFCPSCSDSAIATWNGIDGVV